MPLLLFVKDPNISRAIFTFFIHSYEFWQILEIRRNFVWNACLNAFRFIVCTTAEIGHWFGHSSGWQIRWGYRNYTDHVENEEHRIRNPGIHNFVISSGFTGLKYCVEPKIIWQIKPISFVHTTSCISRYTFGSDNSYLFFLCNGKQVWRKGTVLEHFTYINWRNRSQRHYIKQTFIDW